MSIGVRDGKAASFERQERSKALLAPTGGWPGKSMLWVIALGLVFSPGSRLALADQPHPVTKEGSEEFRRVVKAVLPAVVSIQAMGLSDEGKADLQKRKERLREMLPKQFREQLPKEFREQLENEGGEEEGSQQLGFGSGAIIDKRGYILTNNHVVENAKEVKVILQDGREFESTNIVRDPKADLAIVRLNESDVSSEELPVVELGDSSKAEIGDWVLAMGSPFGLTGTVTSGIISAKGRTPPELNLLYKDFIQTDAAINPGNSGGPLVDLDGKIIGINTAIRSSTGSFGGIGFAIPSSMAKKIVDQLIEFGRVKRSYLGIAMRPLAKKELREKKVDGGVEVTGLAEGPTPARKAGLQPTDVILSIDGTSVGETQELQDLITNTPAGKTVAMKVLRGGDVVDVPVTLEEQPEKFGMTSILASREGSAAVEILGMQLAERKGEVVVLDVSEVAQAAGISEGDVILEVERKPVKSLEDVVSAAKDVKEGVLVKIKKEDGSISLVVVKE